VVLRGMEILGTYAASRRQFKGDNCHDEKQTAIANISLDWGQEAQFKSRSLQEEEVDHFADR
jgi:hypothetical protein